LAFGSSAGVKFNSTPAADAGTPIIIINAGTCQVAFCTSSGAGNFQLDANTGFSNVGALTFTGWYARN
jgi:hypothetical protein